MTHTILRRLAPLARTARLTALVMVAGTAFVTACGVNDQLLSVDNPDVIDPANLGTPDGAEQLRIGALDRWRLTTGGDNVNGNDNTWLFGGLLADEWATSSTFVQNDEVDERRIQTNNSTVTFAFRKLQRVRTAVNQTLPYMRTYLPTSTTKIAELYLARGFAEMQLASDFCNGIPLSDGTQPNTIVFGQPLTDSLVFNVSLASIDSGLAALGTPAVSADTTVWFALRIARARALLGNDRVAEARVAVTTPNTIPVSYAYNHTFSTTNGQNAIWGQPNSGRRYLVGDSVEGNARNLLVKNNIPFFSSKDPRVPSRYTVTVRASDPTKSDTTKSQDGLTNSRTTSLWAETSPIAVLNGIDARLIEAEGRLRAGDAAGMLAILNALRAAPPKVGDITPAAMPALVLPATYDAQVDLLFREKAFWTFGRGQRLGDLRRLIRSSAYNTSTRPRTPDTTFPTGNHYRGGTYGPDVNFPVPQEEQNNPLFTGCIDRKA